MAEVSYNRLNGNVDRLERAISNVNRSINTNKKFAQGVDYSEELRAKSLAALKKDQEELKKLQEQLKKATAALNKFKATERANKGKKEVALIESKYAKLQEALGLQLDPNSAEAKKIKADIDALAKDYQGALADVTGKPVSVIAARAKLTKVAAPTFGKTTKSTATTDKTTTGTTETKPTTLAKPVTVNKTATGTTTVKGTATAGTTTIKPGVPSEDVTGDELDKKEAAEAAVAAAESVGIKTAKGPATPLETLLKQTEFWYDLPDYIFKLDPKLGELLVQAVDEGWDDKKFLAKAQLTPWWQKNANIVRTKIIDRAKYDELKAAGEDVTKTEYGMYLDKQMRAVKAQAKQMSGVTLTDAQAQSIAQKIYDGNLEDDALAINALLVPFLGKVTSIIGNGVSNTSFGGDALKNYQTLQGIAKANGFSIRDILPNVSALAAGGDLETAVLRGLADGSLDINRISQDARMMAAQGQPEYVRGLLNQGYDLQDIYAPYRSQMAAVLELDPNTIELNDPTLRMGITDKGDMNLYDFKKALRQDSRWQYTAGAKEETSNIALGVLRDFGFQG